ncbi:MAG: hypothetical protein H6807_13325 [Planctomycetes bacterium]|nr:hypothetical protein [Planctomycetota bacterium]
MDRTIAEIIREILTRLREARSRQPALRALIEVRLAGLSADEEVLGLLARALGRGPGELRRIASWLTDVLDSTGPRSLHRCVSVSCGAKGAADFWAEFGPCLERAGLGREVVPVHCLGQCEQGPSLALGERVYTAGADLVVVDDRPWRESPFSQES